MHREDCLGLCKSLRHRQHLRQLNPELLCMDTVLAMEMRREDTCSRWIRPELRHSVRSVGKDAEVELVVI